MYGIVTGQVAEEHVPSHDCSRMFPHLMGRRIQLGRLCQLYRLIRMVRYASFRLNLK